MKRALIISYYWPPSSGAGVYRWLKMARYMEQFGWEPVIYTPSNPSVPRKDESLLKDLPVGIEEIKRPILEPLEVYTRLLTRKKKSNVGTGLLSSEKKASWKVKLLFWIRGNLFIPDPRRFWVGPSVRYLKKYLKQNPVDAIISTGPPHSLHLIAMKLARKTGIKWVADFRDPWTNIDFYHQLNLSKLADTMNRRLENKVLQQANLVTTVSKHWAEDLKALGARSIEVITNGFDHEEFEGIQAETNTKFSFIHVGSMNNDRNPLLLWESLDSLIQEKPELKQVLEITLIGDVDYRIFEALDRYQLSDFVKHTAYVPHKEIIKQLVSSSVLLLPLNNTPNVMGIIPGKVFEYLAARRPILAIGPTNGDSAAIISETQGGKVIDYTDTQGMQKVLLNYYKAFQAGNLNSNSEGIEKYSRKNLAKAFCHQLNQLNN